MSAGCADLPATGGATITHRFTASAYICRFPDRVEVDMRHAGLLPRLAGALLLGLAGGALAQSGGATKSGDPHFMQQAASAGVAEVQLGQLALTKSDNDAVKALAQRIVDDHTKANAQLKTIADSEQIALPAPADAARDEAARLRALDGSAFDQAWAKTMVGDHEKAVKLFSDEAAASGDSRLRQFAQATLPTLRAHLQSAKQLTAVYDARDKAMEHATTMDGAPAHQSPTKPASADETPLNAPPSSLPATATSTH
jgi:putative membrane protein